jgi:hypothetical protein
LIETDYEFCAQFVNQLQMTSYVHQLIGKVSSEFFEPVLGVEVVVVHEIPWYGSNDDPWPSEISNANTLLNYYYVPIHRWENQCVTRDANLMLSGRKMAPLGVATGKASRSVKYCDKDDDYGPRLDYALVTNIGTDYGNYECALITHELLHLFGLGHTEGIFIDPLYQLKYPGCDPATQCINNCSIMCTSSCTPNSGNWTNLECFLQDRAQLSTLHPFEATCLLEDTDPVFCKRCRILTNLTRSTGTIYRNTCNGEGDIVKLNFTVCNDGCDPPKNLQIAISTNNCSHELISYTADPGFSAPVYGTINYNYPGNIIGYQFEPFLHSLDECHEYEFVFKVNDCPNQANFHPSLFVNGEKVNETQLPVKDVNSQTIGSDNQTTYLSQLRATNTANLGIVQGSCDNGLSPYPLNLKVLGTIIMDEDYKFKGNIFEMGEDAKIIIAQNKKICFEDAIFYSCEGLWHSISAEPGSALSVDNCDMQDAEHALIFEPNSHYHIKDNKFLNNKTGVWMKGNGSLIDYPKALTTNSFSNNTFSSDRPIKSPYSIYNINLEKAWAGLKFTDHLAKFSVDKTNQFSRMVYGIYADNSFVNVHGATFEDFQQEISPLPFGFKQPASFGVGIMLQNKSVLKHIGGEYGIIDFTNCTNGIIAHNSEVELNNLSFFNVNKGVQLRHTIGGLHKVSGCSFSTLSSGIELYFINPFKLEISDNLFFAESENATAIASQDFLLSSPFISDRVIKNNHIVLSGQSTGLDLNGSADYLVTGNHIQFTDGNDALQTAVKLGNAERNSFKCNIYSSLLPLEDNEDLIFLAGTGIRIDHSPNNEFTCDRHNNLHPWTFNGSCHNTTLTGNYSYGHTLGLNLSGQTIIGPQIKHINEWYGNPIDFPEFEAFYETDLPLLIAGSRFETQAGGAFIPRWKTLVSKYNENPTAGPWFTSTSAPYEECNPGGCNYYSSSFNGDWTELDSLLSTRNRNAIPDFRDGTWWNTQWHLYDRIVKGYYDAFPAYVNDYTDSIAQENMGTLYSVVALMRDAYHIDTMLSSYRQSVLDAATEIHNLDRQILMTPDTQSGTLTILQDQRTLTIQTGDQFNTLALSLVANQLSQMQQKIQQAINSLPIGLIDIPAINLRQTLLYWKYLLSTQGIPNETVKDSLLAIANQCPDDGGMGVHLAQAMLGAWGYNFRDQEPCQIPAQSLSSTALPFIPEYIQLKLTPNPARQSVRIQTAKGKLMKEIRVLNTQGVMVLTVSVSPTEEYVLDIQSLQPGLYIVEALDSQQGIHHARLACVR